MGLHYRKCRMCESVNLHVDNVTPYVKCHNCNSQDTRPLKGRSLVSERLTAAAEVIEISGQDLDTQVEVMRILNEIAEDIAMVEGP